MDLDEMKAIWARCGATLERSLRIDQRILREMLLRKVRFALLPFALWLLVEIAFGGAIAWVAIAGVLDHPTELRYVLLGGALAILAAGITASCAYLFVGGLTLDLSGPITTSQSAIASLRRVELRSFKWALLGGTLLWLPALLLGFEAVTGVDALARVDTAYLLGNLLFGGVVLAVGLVLARKYIEREDLSPLAQRIADGLTGRGLRAASRHLSELAEFQGESV